MNNQHDPVKKTAFIICAILIAGIFFLNNYMMERRFLQYQQSVIGTIYAQEPEACALYLRALFLAETDETSLAAGEVAMVEYAYTSKGFDYLLNQNRMYSVYLLTGSMLLLVLAVVIFLMSMNRKKRVRNTARLLERIDALERAQEQSAYLQVQNQRLQAFIENVAHQIRTPVNRVMTALELLQEEAGENGRQSERLMECVSHLESVRQLMARLLDIGRMEAGKVLFRREYMQLSELLQECALVCGDAQGKAVVRIVPEGDTAYYGDFEWLREAFINILKNCFEHDHSDQPVEITCRREAEYYMIQVRDHGTGLAETDIPNLFDRFYLPENVKSNHVGIGLNLAKLIIEAHFGTIHAFNHEEGGAVFELLLPIYALKTKNADSLRVREGC